jgi:hypothetical protein
MSVFEDAPCSCSHVETIASLAIGWASVQNIQCSAAGHNLCCVLSQGFRFKFPVLGQRFTLSIFVMTRLMLYQS